MAERPLILASTSSYRRLLLDRLRLPYQVEAPGTDETPRPGEAPRDLAGRLAIAKATAVAARHAAALVIGSDQVAALDGAVVSKPGDRAGAIAQLARSSGRTVDFHTALAVVDAASGRVRSTVETVPVVFRALAMDEIERYVDLDRPFDCAGSFKAESLGIALFDRIGGRDPTALVGLPLISLAAMLRELGVAVP